MFFDVYLELCRQRGISPTAAALEMGIGRSTVSAWKKEGRTPTGATLQKVADYFGVPVGQLLGGAPAPKADPTDDDIKFALFEGGPVTDAQFEEVKQFVRFIKERDANGGKT